MIKEDAQTIEQQVYDLVKSRILTLEWKPGQYVNDQDVADELRISRTPVRDAFHRLEFERLLNRQARKGWQVSPLFIDDIREIFSVKEVLQGMLSYQAAGCQDAALRAAFQSAVDDMQAANACDDQCAWESAHIRFHDLLLRMTEHPNGRVIDILNQLNDQWRRIRRGLYAIEGYRDRENADHIEMARAILANDPAAAEQVTRLHLQRVRNEVMQLLEHLVFPFLSYGL